MSAYRDLFSLDERVFLVTGGAGHLGQEISRGLAAYGARVVVLGRSAERFEALKQDPSGRIECHVCDVTDERAIEQVMAQVWKAHGRIDGLVNNAAAGKRESWDALDKRAWLEGLEGTLNHYFTCTKAVSGYMLKRGAGTVINNASLWAFLAPQFSMYLDLKNEPAAHTPAAKGAILQLTRYLASLWGGKGIRVNAISPGWFPKKGRGPERPDYMREITSRVPLGRVGAPPDLVGAVLFLASDASAYVTGQNLVVDGGYSIW